MSFNLIDVVFIAIFLVFVAFSAKKGFARVVLNIAAIVIAIVLATYLSTPLSKIIYTSFIETKVVEKLEESIPESITEATEKLSYIKNSMPDFAKSYIDKNETINNSLNAININSVKSRAELIEQLNINVIKPFCENILRITCYVSLAIVLSFIFRLLSGFFGKSIHKSLKTPDYILGGILGLIEGALALYIISIFLLYISRKTTSHIGDITLHSVLVNKLSQIFRIKLI